MAIGKIGFVLASGSLIIIVLYLLPNKDQIENIQQMALIVGGIFFLGLILMIAGAKTHAKQRKWI